jgi:hypothetical protein
VADILAVAGISAALGSAAAERVSAAHISVARAWAAGQGYRGLRHGPVSAVNARSLSTAVQTGRPAAGQR